MKSQNPTDIGAIIVGHGSQAKEAAATLNLVTDMVGRSFSIQIELASLQFNKPDVSDAVMALVTRGLRKIVIVPFFLLPGNHVNRDLPEMIAEEKAKNPGIEFIITAQLGADPRLVSMLVSRIGDAVEALNGTNGHMIHNPGDIEAESFRIIEGYIPALAEESVNNEVIKRIVHATGDISVAAQVQFATNAVERAAAAIREGRPIITDVGMVKAGIGLKRIERFGCDVICLIGDETVAAVANENMKTRAAIGMEQAALEHPDAIFVIGNAPSALQALCDLIDAGRIEPSAVIGVPVGFVGAAESKDRLTKKAVPWITIIGSRGGSAAAAAAVNAIAIIAGEKG